MANETHWAAKGPNGEQNIVLARTVAGSFEQKIHGDRYPALATWNPGGVDFALPVLEDGTPDVKLQEKGFYHEYAHRIIATCPHYKEFRPKGE